MYHFRQAALCTIALTVLTIAGCTTTAPKTDSIDVQRSAMQRWNACLERNSNPQSITAIRVSQLVNHDCEGHKRDVIAAFPPHMAQQIDHILIGSAYELLESRQDSMELTAEHGELIQTLLR